MSTEIIGSELRIKVDGAIANLTALGNAGDAAGKKVARESIKALKELTTASVSAAKAAEAAGAASVAAAKATEAATAAAAAESVRAAKAVEKAQKDSAIAAVNARQASEDATNAFLRGQGRSATAARGTSSALTQLSFQLNDVATMAAMGANPMQILASQGGQIVQVAQQAGGALPLMKAAIAAVSSAASAAIPVLIALAAPIAIIGTTMAAVKLTIDAYTASKKEATRATEQLTAAMLPLDAALTSAQAENDLLTQAQGLGNEAMREYVETATSHAAIDAKVTESTKAHREEQTKLNAELAKFSNQNSFDALKVKGRLAQVEREIELAEEKGSSLKQLSDGSRELRKGLEGEATAHAKAGKAAAKAGKETLTFEQQVLELQAKVADRKAQKDIELREEHNKNLQEQAAVDIDTAEAVAKAEIKAAEDAAKAQKKADEEVAAAAAAQQKELASIRDASLGALQNIAQAFSAATSASLATHMESLDAVQARLEDIRDGLEGLGVGGVDAAKLTGKALTDAYLAGEVGVDDLTATQKEALEKELLAQEQAAVKKEKIEKAAAKKAFELNQAASIAAAAVAGLVGMVSAFQLGPIAGAIASVGIAALTATNIELIRAQKPKFHAGGIGAAAVMYPDERSATVLSGEGVLNRQAVQNMGPQAVHAMNAGQSPAGGVTVLRIGRNEAREIARTDIKSNGIIPQTINKLARRSGFGAGRSGRLAKA